MASLAMIWLSMVSGLRGWFQRGRSSSLTAQRVLFPLFEIVSNPTIRISDVKARRFHIIDRVPNCDTCARQGHGPTYEQCKAHVEELDAAGMKCWRPIGSILVWDDKEVTDGPVPMDA